MTTDYYRLLEIDPEASPEVVDKAYKALMFKYHPDRQPPERRDWATEKVRELNSAYQVLSDPIKRRNYSMNRRLEYWRVWWEEGLVGLARWYLR